MSPRHIPDGMKCINCYAKASGGAIKHTFRCPEHRRPRRGATSVSLGDVLRTSQ